PTGAWSRAGPERSSASAAPTRTTPRAYRSADSGRAGRGRLLQQIVQLREQLDVALLVVAGQAALEIGQAFEERRQPLRRQLVRAQAVTLGFEIARVQHLLELPADRNRQHRAAQVDR